MKPEDRLIHPAELNAWRKRIGVDVPITLLTGTFDMLQPGNLHAVAKAREAANPVVVVLEPDEVAARHKRSGLPQNRIEVRAEMVAHVRGVDGVTAITGCDVFAFLARMVPFVWVIPRTRRSTDIWGPFLEKTAVSVMEIEALAGCSTEDIIRTMREGRTPVRLPSGAFPLTADGFRLAGARAGGGSLVTVNGCFDILHVGHLRFLAAARAMGERLTVLINDDASVARYKGPTRPVFPEPFRRAALKALVSVDDVVSFAEDEPLRALGGIRPDIHVKGGSFEAERVRRERDLVSSWGGRLADTPLVDGYSTSAYIAKALGQKV